MVLMEAATYFGIGMIAGVLAGALGIGSGVFVVPALTFVFASQAFPADLVMHLAAGTSLATIAVTTTRGLISHVKRHIKFWEVYKLIFPGVITGTVIGAIFAHYLHAHALSIIFGIVVLLLGIKMFFPSSILRHKKLPGLLGCSSAGLIVGVKSGLLGLGGGAVTTPFLTHFGVPIRQAVVVSTAVSLTVSIVGAISLMLVGLNTVNLPSWSTGYVYWPAWFGIIAGSLIFAPLGVKLSHSLSVTALRRIFAVFLIIVGLHMLHSAWL